MTSGKDRIAKVLARAGLCSRREAERWITTGRVAINGRILDTPIVLVSLKDTITIDGNPIPKIQRPRLWRYHKSAGLITTHKDPKGRPTVFGQLPSHMPRVISVGRLDLNSEGLLLLTNDGSLARKMELPITGWIRRYRARVYGQINEKKLKELKDGITLDGIRYGPITASLDKQTTSNAWISVSLTEGKNREVRKIMEHLDLSVARLIRISYGPFQLGNLARGAVEEVKYNKVLRE